MGERRLDIHGTGLDRTRRRWGKFFRPKEIPKIRVLCYPDHRLPPIYHTLERPICEPLLARPACFRERELASSLAQRSRMTRAQGARSCRDEGYLPWAPCVQNWRQLGPDQVPLGRR